MKILELLPENLLLDFVKEVIEELKKPEFAALLSAEDRKAVSDAFSEADAGSPEAQQAEDDIEAWAKGEALSGSVDYDIQKAAAKPENQFGYGRTAKQIEDDIEAWALSDKKKASKK